MKQVLYILQVKSSKFLEMDEKLFRFRTFSILHYLFLTDRYFGDDDAGSMKWKMFFIISGLHSCCLVLKLFTANVSLMNRYEFIFFFQQFFKRCDASPYTISMALS